MRLILRSGMLALFFMTETSHVWAQPGRYVPPAAPRGVGGGFRFYPHTTFFSGGGDPGNGVMVLLAVLLLLTVCIIVLCSGWHLGRRLGTWIRGDDRSADSSRCRFVSGDQTGDLIIPVEQVAEKAAETERLMTSIASRDSDLAPQLRRLWIEETFRLVFKCWSERDYTPLRGLLAPKLLATHEQQLAEMRKHGELNRIDELTLDRLEFVSIVSPTMPGRLALTVLITYTARMYYVNDRSGAYVRDSQQPRRFQEFWTFHRTEGDWRLQEIARSHEAGYLTRPNRVSDFCLA